MLLTDGQIWRTYAEAITEFRRAHYISDTKEQIKIETKLYGESIAKAQLKKVVEWLLGWKATIHQPTYTTHTRFDIPTDKLQSLLEEVKE